MPYQRVVISKRGGPEVLEVVESELREPGADEVGVKVKTAGVSYAEVLQREGLYPNTPTLPYTPGYDIVGVVDRVGSGVTQFQPGQGVAALVKFGGYTEYAYVPAAKLVPVPDGLDSAEVSVLILNYLTAYQLLHRMARLAKGERILVHAAAGGVGTALLELGRLAELEMYGTASKNKHALVQGYGATVIDYKNEDFVQRVRALTGDGVDAVFDAIGGSHWKRSFQTLRNGGRLVAYGFQSATPGGRRNLLNAGLGMVRMPRFSPLQLLPQSKAIMGYDVNMRPDWNHRDLRTLIDLLAEGKIKPVVAQRLPLKEVAHAHELLGSGAVSGKIVLVMS